MRALQNEQAAHHDLSAAEAEALLKRDGFNELPSPDRRTLPRIVAEVLREPMLALLLGGGLVYLALGDTADAVILLVFAMLSILITVIQEARTERTLEALRDLTSPRALVIRDGEQTRIAGREVVRGDLLLLGEGDRVPADAVLVDCADLSVDESLLTGESVPVRKTPAGARELPASVPDHGDDGSCVFSGTLIVRGSGLARVTATGARSKIGKIGQSLALLATEPPRLRVETMWLVRVAAVAGGAFSIMAVLLYGLLRDDWLQAALGGIALGMAMLPEEFPVVLAVFMAMGAWRMSKAHVLTRRAAAIETLGAATVLCTDKTGTLTENRMAVAELRAMDYTHVLRADTGGASMQPQFRELVEVGRLASAPVPFDPMEKAFHTLARDIADPGATPTSAAHPADWTLLKTYGLRPDLLAMTQVWDGGRDCGDLVIAAKGAPEAIARLCGLEPEMAAAQKADVDSMARRGLRVLAMARGEWAEGALPEEQTGFTLTYLGLVGLPCSDRYSLTQDRQTAETRSAA
jgi:P-type Ca2+ transporter type 2C